MMKKFNLLLIISLFCTLSAKSQIEEGYYALKTACDPNFFYTMSMPVTPKKAYKDGTNVQLMKSRSEVSWMWKFLELSDHTFLIQEMFNDTMDVAVAGGKAYDGANVVYKDYDGSFAQRWYVEPVEASYIDGDYFFYIVRSKLNRNYVLELENGKVADGTNILLKPYTGAKNQMWHFFKI